MSKNPSPLNSVDEVINTLESTGKFRQGITNMNVLLMVAAERPNDWPWY